MSTVTTAADAPVSDGPTTPSVSMEGRDRLLGRFALFLAIGVLGWSILELINLALKHTTGPEVYGVLTAALATGAGIAGLALLRFPRTPAWVTIAVVALWAVVAVGGVAGVVAHLVGLVPGHGPIDPRPRPIAAPLVFTMLGIVGGTALVVGRRVERRRMHNP